MSPRSRVYVVAVRDTREEVVLPKTNGLCAVLFGFLGCDCRGRVPEAQVARMLLPRGAG